MTHRLVTTRALGGSKLGRAAASGELPATWLSARPTSAAEWRARAEEVRMEARTTGWLDTLAPALDPSGAARARLERAAGGKGVVVTTGQQPGLFGGPIYTWAKALSALAFANAIERASGVAAVPIFWAATDDADYEEARSTLVAVTGGVQKLELPDATRPGLPMSEVPLRDTASLLARLSSGAGSAANGQVLGWVRDAYEDGTQTVGGAYVRLLRSVLEPLGIAVLDASHPAVRRAMHPLMITALQNRSEIGRALETRTAEIRAAGFEPQVELVKNLTLVSRTTNEGKDRVPHGRADELAKSAEAGSLGPTVLLRPIAERAILPTVAYLAGPGELAYFAQVSAVSAALGAADPLALPRWSCTIVEPHIARILDRHGIAVDELAHESAVESRLAREAMPNELRRSLDDLRGSVETSLRKLAGSTILDDGPLVDPRVPEGARIALNHRVDRLERRLVAALARRETEVARDVATARAALYPQGKPQERALNFIPLLARQGPPLIDAMLAEASRHAADLVSPDEAAGRQVADGRGSAPSVQGSTPRG